MMGMRGVRGVAVLLAVIVGFVGTRSASGQATCTAGLPGDCEWSTCADDQTCGLQSFYGPLLYSWPGGPRELPASVPIGACPDAHWYGGACAFDLDDTEGWADCIAYIEFEVTPSDGVDELACEYLCFPDGYPPDYCLDWAGCPAAYANVQFLPLKPGLVEISTQADDCGQFCPDEADTQTGYLCLECSGPTTISVPDGICPGHEETASAVGVPTCRMVAWQITESCPDDLDVILIPNEDPIPGDGDYSFSHSVQLRVREGSGELLLRAMMAEFPDCYYETKVQIGCAGGCSSGSCNDAGDGGPSQGQCNLKPTRRPDCKDPIGGTTDSDPLLGNGGPNFAFSLGGNARGSLATSIRLSGNAPTERLSSPRALTYNGAGSLFDPVHVVRTEAGDLLQIRAPGALAAIDDSIANGYAIKFYGEPAADWVEYWGGDRYYPTGLTPFASWVVEAPEGDLNRLRISKHAGDLSGPLVKAFEYTYDPYDDSWQLSTENSLGQVARTSQETWVWSGSGWTRTTRSTQDGGLYNEVIEEYAPLGPAGEKRLVLRSVTYEPDVPRTIDTSYGYYVSPSPHAGQLKWWWSTDGSWGWYVYEDSAPEAGYTTTTVYRPWRDKAFPGENWVPSGTESDVAVQATVHDALGRPVTDTVTVNASVVEQTARAYTTEAGTGNPQKTEDRYTDPAGATYLRTITTFDVNNPNDPVRVVYPDQRVDYYFRDRVDFDEDHPETPSYVPDTAGSHRRTVVYHYAPGPAQVSGQSTISTTIEDEAGHVWLNETFVAPVPDPLAGQPLALPSTQRIQWVSRRFDNQGRETDTYRSNGEHTNTDYAGCCQNRTVTDAAGVETYYEFDVLGRPVEVRRNAATKPGGPDHPQTTEYAYGYANGPTVTTTVTGPVTTVATETTYDLAGRIKSESTLNNEVPVLTTTYAYVTDGYRQVTVTRPDTSTEVTTYYRDGSVKSEAGTGIVPRAYEYDVGEDGLRSTQVTEGPTGSQRVTSTTVDWLGRTVLETQPAWQSGVLTTKYEYYPNGAVGAGQIKRSWTEDPLGAYVRARTVYVYNGLGNLVRSGLDLDGDDALDLADSADRYTATAVNYVDDGNGGWYRLSTTQTATENGLVTTGTTQERLTNFPVDRIRDVLTFDVHGNATRSFTTVDRSARTVTEWIDHPDSTSDEKRITINGLLMEQQSKTGARQTYTYDPVNCQAEVRRGDTLALSRTHYNSLGQADWTEDAPGNRTIYEYYGNGEVGAGKVRTITTPTDDWTDAPCVDPTGETCLQTYYEYDSTTPGQPVLHVWGDVPQPAAYSYDALGRLATLTTFRSGSGLENSSWPSPTGGDVTTWVYDSTTGLLTDKIDDAGKTTSYTYTSDGRVKTRTSARSKTSTYAYYGENPGELNTGELKQITYNDDTPSVEFTYSRSGAPATIVDATGTHTFNYNTAMQLVSETIDDALYSDPITITQQYHSGSDTSGRYEGVSITQDATPVYSASYDYDAVGRLHRVTGPGLPTAGSDSCLHGALYAYQEGTDIVERVDIAAAIVPDPDHPFNYEQEKRVARRYQHEPQRDVIDYVQNMWYPDDDNVELSKYDYTNGDLGLRQNVEYSGVAFGSPTPSIMQSFGYDDRNELIISSRGTRSWTYAYDPIGNRTTYIDDPCTPVETTYVINELNQIREAESALPGVSPGLWYDADGNLAREYNFIPADMNCDGVANFGDINAFVTACNGQAAYEAVYPYCNWLNGDCNSDGTVSVADNNCFIARISQGGSGVTRTYTWDAENRLTRVGPPDGMTPDDGATRVSFAYDYLGRRVWKQTETYTGEVWGVSAVRKYVWDGWRMLLEMDGDGTILRKYSWGLDLAGQAGQVNSLEGAGTIGGLLAMCWPNGAVAGGRSMDLNAAVCYDGNGNVTQLVNWEHSAGDPPGALLAMYEYDPYGNVTSEMGSYATANAWRFSTKQFDAETGLGYWGYRYYSPTLGRWISRDPIEEGDGPNVYAYVADAPSQDTDYLGMGTILGGDRVRVDPTPWRPRPSSSAVPGDPLAFLQGMVLENGLAVQYSVPLYVMPPWAVFGTVSVSASAVDCQKDRRCCTQWIVTVEGTIRAQAGGGTMAGGPLSRKAQPGGGTCKAGKRTKVPGLGRFNKPVRNSRRGYYRGPADDGPFAKVIDPNWNRDTCKNSLEAKVGFRVGAAVGLIGGVQASAGCDYTFGSGWKCEPDWNAGFGINGVQIYADGHLGVSLYFYECTDARSPGSAGLPEIGPG